MMYNPLKLTVTILTKNSQRYLAEVLESVKWVDEVLIYDNGSEDDTLKIAEEFSNVKIIKGDFLGFGPTHNKASNLAQNDWIFSLDSDEIVTEELAHTIQQLKFQDNCIYSVLRKNFYNNTWIKWCGWYPDRQLRIYNRKQTQFTEAQVHEAIIKEDKQVINLDQPIIHYSYDSHSDFIKKMQSYSDLFAKQNVGKKKSSISTAILHGLSAFFKSYVIKRGVFGGYEGFVISVYNGNTAFYKYLKLYEANTKLDSK